MNRYTILPLVLTVCLSGSARAQLIGDPRGMLKLDGDARAVSGPSNLADPAYDIYVNPLHIGQAWREADASLMTDVALQLAEGERVLLRPRKGISAKQAFDVALRVASERNDQAALQRIAKHAANNDDKELVGAAGAAQKLASVSRDTTWQMMVDAEKINPEDYGLMHDCLGQLRMAKLAGDTRTIDLIEDRMSRLPESLQAGLTKCIGDARHSAETTKPVPPELVEQLKRLAAISRPDGGLNDPGAYGDNDETETALPPVPVTGTF